MNIDIAAFALWALPVLLALVCHEWAHGFVANQLGDDTAARHGRLTFNPASHIDPVGTILLPGMLIASQAGMVFGWAKPVPVQWSNLGNPIRDMVLVAAAGPAMNMILAVLGALILGGLMATFGVAGVFRPLAIAGQDWAVLGPCLTMLEHLIQVNVWLALFNMLPIPPLDGGRVAVGLLPDSVSNSLAQIEPFGMFIVILLLMTDLISKVLGPIGYEITRALMSLAWSIPAIF